MADELPKLFDPKLDRLAQRVAMNLATAVIMAEIGGVDRATLHAFVDHVIDQSAAEKSQTLMG